MGSFKLSKVELAVVLNYIHATKIPGVKLNLPAVDEKVLLKGNSSLLKRKLLTKAKQPNTFHLNQELLDAAIGIAISAQLVLVRVEPEGPSIQFGVTQKLASSIVVTPDETVLCSLKSIDEIASVSIRFINKSDAKIAIASLVKEELVADGKASVEKGSLLANNQSTPLTEEALSEILRSGLTCRTLSNMPEDGQKDQSSQE